MRIVLTFLIFDRNAAHAAFTIVREEGISTLYRGVALTALRQATNQGEIQAAGGRRPG